MAKDKVIRDPMYGYIKVPGYLAILMDTPEFQRLRNIRQTSYQALYPSALHNRFVHSLGVFCLGNKAIDFFEKNIISQNESLLEDSWQTVRCTFLSACLLHDVGHSPFSHTGEEFYNKGIDFVRELAIAVGVPEYALDANYKPKNDDEKQGLQFFLDLKQGKSGTGKPHEAMSALIGLELCKRYSIKIDRDLFVRCIIGAKYGQDCTFSQAYSTILNAVIELLNGDIIDVDKLDYISRDSFVTGYRSMSLDIDRLLSNFTVCPLPDGKYQAVYMKGALSVIENVIYANDQERRWIQSHPAILYDCQIVDSLLRLYDSYMRGLDRSIPTVFTREALSTTGMPGLVHPLKLLCDDDIISYIKNECNEPIAQQFFSRSKRLKPLWKTEAAFEHLVNKILSKDVFNQIVLDLRSLSDSIQVNGAAIINQAAMDELTSRVEQATEPGWKESYQRAADLCRIFSDFRTEKRLHDFEFMLLFTNRFQTGYKKLSIADICIQLESGIVPLTDVLSVQAKEANHELPRLFYLYTTAENLQGNDTLGADFIDFLRKHFNMP